MNLVLIQIILHSLIMRYFTDRRLLIILCLNTFVNSCINLESAWVDGQL